MHCNGFRFKGGPQQIHPHTEQRLTNRRKENIGLVHPNLSGYQTYP